MLRTLSENRSFGFKLGVVLVVGFIFLALASFLEFPLVERLFIHYGAKAYPLNSQLWLEQTFLPARDKLIGLRLFFKKTNEVEHPLKLELIKKISHENQQLLYQTQLSSKNLTASDGYNFWLSVPLVGKGESFGLFFSAPVSSASASVSPIVSGLNNYLEGEATTSLGPTGGDIVFEPIYQVRGYKVLTHYLNRIVFGKAPLVNKYSLGLLFLVWLVSFITLALVFLASLKEEIALAKFFSFLFIFFLVLGILFYQPSTYFILSKV